MWRFEAIDDLEVEIMMSRDTDTRIYLREKEEFTNHSIEIQIKTQQILKWRAH